VLAVLEVNKLSVSRGQSQKTEFSQLPKLKKLSDLVFSWVWESQTWVWESQTWKVFSWVWEVKKLSEHLGLAVEGCGKHNCFCMNPSSIVVLQDEARMKTMLEAQGSSLKAQGSRLKI
jgi:hypothetical protein